MAVRQDIAPASDFFTGEDKDLVFTIYTTNAQTVAQDITGWTVSWMLKANKTDADGSALLTKTTVSGIVLTTAASGILTVSLTDTDIASLKGGVLYFHELKRTTDGQETVLSYGAFTLNQAVHT
jgi:hypothetical protein